MRKNQCGTCKHGFSMYGERGWPWDRWQRFYVVCGKLDMQEITPILHDFVATCGCASFEEGDA